ncbi:MAG: peptidylprolyl isomerase [Candidatus Electrothrix aestuarii]|uniref:Peptidyl-prolyl cis-trans isomerase n=1 Tax=Candidatus Electrothrix aestuarii TaxID=3062594 RepID=A0AAU8LP84_9BACT|nr:peptidylprolyl isomerase [Candidatus Electrothrix aestuarii]
MCPVALTDTVTVAYTASLETGELIEQRDEKNPAVVSIGSGALCKAVEACLFGMEPGQSRVIRVDPEDAYGTHHKELMQQVPLSHFQGKLDPKPGMVLSLTVNREGEEHKVPATITEVQQDHITVDYNHPLAGQIIVYEVKLLNIS